MAKYNEFGQVGSIFSLGGADVIPPAGMCIVAIQFLADNILTKLTAVPPSGANYEYIGVAASHNGTTPIINTDFSGGAMVAGTTELTLDNVTSVYVGQAVTGTGIDGTQEHPVTVKKITSSTTIELSRGVPAIGDNVAISFHDFYGSGTGGETTVAAVWPKGMTIYGKWEKVRATADANGGIVCYLGLLRR